MMGPPDLGTLVDGKWLVPALKIKKTIGFKKCFMFSEDIRYILPSFCFMFFDRYEINIQAFVDCINGNVSFPDPHLRKI